MTPAGGKGYCSRDPAPAPARASFPGRSRPPTPQEAVLTVTKRDLIHRIAQATGQTKVLVQDIIQRFLDEVADELVAGNRIEFRNFGVFEVRVRPPRTAVNPRDGSRIDVPPRRTVRFKLGQELRGRIEKAGPEGRRRRPRR